MSGTGVFVVELTASMLWTWTVKEITEAAGASVPMTKAWPVCEFCVPVSELEDMLLPHPAARKAARERHPRRADLTGRLRNIDSHLFPRTIATYAEQAPSGQRELPLACRDLVCARKERPTGRRSRAQRGYTVQGSTSCPRQIAIQRETRPYRVRLRAWLPLILTCDGYGFGEWSSLAAVCKKPALGEKLRGKRRKFSSGEVAVEAPDAHWS